jgi:hypothetical protein
VNDFVALNNRYPLPASFTRPVNDPANGTEGIVAPPSCDTPSWVTSEGMCLSPNGDVLVGAVPFQVLGLRDEDALDFWNQKIVYAVTLAQTDPATYQPDDGGRIFALEYSISAAGVKSIVDVMDTSGPPTPLNYDMILLSLGNEGRGAFTREGVAVMPCDTTLAEAQNCDFTHQFLLDRSTGLPSVGSRSYADNAEYYDDITSPQTTVPGDQWRRNRVVGNFVVGSAARVGVGTTFPDFRVHVVGAVQAATDVRSDRLCDEDASDCFNPEMIAGALTEMDCNKTPATMNAPVVELGAGRVRCGVPSDSGGSAIPSGNTPYLFPAAHFGYVDCSVAGQLMIGINPSGAPICATP